eukprot:CAMPEP_0184308474 /NCGR_PEP_ID=MMETSP1049-20130417/16919_1 /TAXON_ID=77928 /ORGANISM="Proteomonas sulcata, Strain CCMP704" /LENGTH=137 /DNA_ID=CAMNT_0026621171 /DNA_START=17 /DNA_END=430 /DNA_ORIENTATION=-
MQSISKLEKSLEIFPDNHNAMVVLASALNAKAFLQHDPEVAKQLFDRSKTNFQKALELDPGNTRYRQLLDAMENAPQLHAQVVAQLQAQGQLGGGGGGGGKGVPGDDDWIYDWLGWGILITGGIALVAALNAKGGAA